MLRQLDYQDRVLTASPPKLQGALLPQRAHADQQVEHLPLARRATDRLSGSARRESGCDSRAEFA